MRFDYVSCRLCLDFAGTKKSRGRSGTEEQLTEPGRLSDWAVQAGLVDAAMSATDQDLAAAISLREAIHRTVTAKISHRRPIAADVDLINQRAAQPRLTPKLQRTGGVSRDGDATQLLATLAADLVGLFAGPDIGFVKRCANPNCTRLYVDSSRARNRHWCGMSPCGNRAKVEAFRARERAGQASAAKRSPARK
jgi:predicted RNA-binding Zn ribbon-like protein